MDTIKRGDRTKNGAIVIDVKRDWLGWVVLCLWVEDTQNPETGVMVRTFDPYVTWLARIKDDQIVCESGHYYDILQDAVLDFDSRL